MQEHTYDLVPYESTAFPQTHPDRLATLARLFGVDAPSIEGCRVLELGAGTGGNLIPMAYGLPGATFVGIDLSARHVVEGAKAIEALGLTNVSLTQMSIEGPVEDLGQFDYILCHGVYSWVPDAVREAILTIFRRQLAPNGVGYVSYNTHPGWHIRGTIRGIARYHASLFDDPAQKIRHARAAVDFLAKSVAADDPYGALLKSEVELLSGQSDSYFFHEHLEDNNLPLYFHEFAAQAKAHDLQYLGDADFSTMLVTNFPPEVAEALRRMSPDMIRMEQYMDFLRKRAFRTTLLVHKEHTLTRNLGAANVRAFYFASAATPSTPSFDPASTEPAQFRSREGVDLSTTHRITKAAMVVLASRWPEAVQFDELLALARALLESKGVPAGGAEEEARTLGADLITAYGGRLVALRVTPVQACRSVSERPVANPVARFEAKRGGRVTNQHHDSVMLDQLKRHVLEILDGAHDRAAIIAHVVELALNGGPLVIRHKGQPVTDPVVLRSALEGPVSAALASLAATAFLVA